jgi:Uma2 family endonuclease
MSRAGAHRKVAYTVDQYLAIERAAEDRHYYLDGEIYAMAGESDAHGVITVNLVGSLFNQLRGTPCQVRTKDTKVRSGPILSAEESARGLFSYPDVLVLCGDPENHDALKDVVLNPKVIFEVLSERTEAFDRGEKFTRFQTWNPSLTDYVLVSQDRAQVEHFTRQPDGTWSYRRTTGLDASVVSASIHCTLKLADVYERVALPADEPPESGR